MRKQTPQPGQPFPTFSVPQLGGGELTVGATNEETRWTLLVVYRGLHCPLCTRYLNELDEAYDDLQAQRVDAVAISADTAEKATKQLDDIQPQFDVGYNLSIEQMQALGLYISTPRSPEESDRPFAEPGIFVIDERGHLQLIDKSNAPFVRPEINTLVSGLKYIRNPENNYPTRGTYL